MEDIQTLIIFTLPFKDSTSLKLNSDGLANNIYFNFNFFQIQNLIRRKANSFRYSMTINVIIVSLDEHASVGSTKF